MKKIIPGLILCLCLLTACARVEEGEDVKNQERPWAKESTKEVDTEYIGEETAAQEHSSGSAETVVDEEESKRLAAEEESRKEADKARNIDHSSLVINLINQEHMPVASDTVTYSGTKMKYAAALTNDTECEVYYTFMILVNGVPQPFIPEDGAGEIYSAKYEMQPYEEKIIDFSFIPICAPYGGRALFSVVGISALKKPYESFIFSNMNVVGTAYSKYLTAVSKKCEISLSERMNESAKEVSPMKNTDYGDRSSSMVLSQSAQNEENIDMYRSNKYTLNAGEAVDFYFAKRKAVSERCFLFEDGLLVSAFSGNRYIDFPKDRLMFYKAPVDKSVFSKGTAHTGLIMHIDRDSVSEILNADSEEALYEFDVFFSALYTIR